MTQKTTDQKLSISPPKESQMSGFSWQTAQKTNQRISKPKLCKYRTKRVQVTHCPRLFP